VVEGLLSKCKALSSKKKKKKPTEKRKQRLLPNFCYCKQCSTCQWRRVEWVPSACHKTIGTRDPHTKELQGVSQQGKSHTVEVLTRIYFKQDRRKGK
jgi:hypothetical protein